MLIRISKIKSPLAKHIFGVGIRGREKTFNLNALIYCPGKTCKFPAVHLPAYKFS